MHTSLRLRLSLAGTAVALTAAATVASSAGASTWSPSSYDARLIQLVNAARSQHGLAPLTVASGTTQVASGWTSVLASRQALSHNPNLGSQLESHGSANWTTYGENVGEGAASDPQSLFDAYMQSPEHRANILNGDYRYVGAAVVFTGSTAWNTFDFVDQYGASSSSPAPAPRHTTAPAPRHTTAPAPVQRSVARVTSVKAPVAAAHVAAAPRRAAAPRTHVKGFTRIAGKLRPTVATRGERTVASSGQAVTVALSTPVVVPTSGGGSRTAVSALATLLVALVGSGWVAAGFRSRRRLG